MGELEWRRFARSILYDNNDSCQLLNGCTACRMPVILSAQNTRRWIDGATYSRETLLSLLAPADENLLDYREVSRAVNNSRNEGPELIEPR